MAITFSTIISAIAGGFLYWFLLKYGIANSFLFSLGFSIIVWIAVFVSINTFRKKNFNEEEKIRKQYATGFKWGKREHTAELYTTRVLVIGILILCLHLWLKIYWIEFVALGLFIIAWILRVIAAYCHGQEKKYMDELRFNKK